MNWQNPIDMICFIMFWLCALLCYALNYLGIFHVSNVVIKGCLPSLPEIEI